MQNLVRTLARDFPNGAVLIVGASEQIAFGLGVLMPASDLHLIGLAAAPAQARAMVAQTPTDVAVIVSEAAPEDHREFIDDLNRLWGVASMVVAPTGLTV